MSLTLFAHRSLRDAQSAARDRGHAQIVLEDLLVGIVAQGRHGAAPVALADLRIDAATAHALADRVVSIAHDELSDTEALAALGIDLAEVRRRVRDALGTTLELPEADPPPSESLDVALRLAVDEAAACGDTFIGTEHLLLGLAAHDEHLGSDLFARCGLDTAVVRHRITAACAFVSYLLHAYGDRTPVADIADLRARANRLPGGQWDKGMAVVQVASDHYTAALSDAYTAAWPPLPAALSAMWRRYQDAVRTRASDADAIRDSAFAPSDLTPGRRRYRRDVRVPRRDRSVQTSRRARPARRPHRAVKLVAPRCAVRLASAPAVCRDRKRAFG
ncbi:MAG: Clp protease N-terminal domain-containing protein [Acidimicrobiales bacterium]